VTIVRQTEAQMDADNQSKIALDVRIVEGTVRLSKSRVSIFQDETPVVRRPHDLRGRFNPVPLLTFFAYCKLHFIQNKEEPFQARSGDHKWVIQLYDLIKNCGKRETCWLEKVFGSHRTTPNVCAIHKIITPFKDGHEHVVALTASAPRADEIELSVEGTPAESEGELCEFLKLLGAGDEMATSPDSLGHRAAATVTPLAADADSSSNPYDLPERFRGSISLRFPKFNLVQHEFERACLRQLAATQQLEIKWLSVRMEYGDVILPDLLRTLVDSVPECEIKVLVALLSPDWPYLERLHPTWPDEVRKNCNKLRDLGALYREKQGALKKRKVTIVVREYEYIPNWHGVVMNDSRFFIGHCSWRESVPGSNEKVLTGGENPYMLLCAEKGGFEGWLAEHFLGWFDYAFNWSSSVGKKQPVVAGHRF
jgi:hypothetical protein